MPHVSAIGETRNTNSGTIVSPPASHHDMYTLSDIKSKFKANLRFVPDFGGVRRLLIQLSLDFKPTIYCSITITSLSRPHRRYLPFMLVLKREFSNSDASNFRLCVTLASLTLVFHGADCSAWKFSPGLLSILDRSLQLQSVSV